MQREGLKCLWIGYEDLHVHQSEYQSSCATVLMLDCSRSMILYGEDRFTPAKKVAMALAHLIRTQYPGRLAALRPVPRFGGGMRIEELARVQVGPYYTNTREGLMLAQRLLTPGEEGHEADHHDHRRQARALTLEDGRIYRNAFGLDPLVISRTLEESNRCSARGF